MTMALASHSGIGPWLVFFAIFLIVLALVNYWLRQRRR